MAGILVISADILSLPNQSKAETRYQNTWWGSTFLSRYDPLMDLGLGVAGISWQEGSVPCHLVVFTVPSVNTQALKTGGEVGDSER